MKTKLIVLSLLAASGLFAQVRVVAGVRFGYAPPVVRYAAPTVVTPGPGYTWVAPYYYPYGGRYAWHAGYWARPAFVGAHWVSPYWAHGYYYHGYWRR